MHLQVSQTFPLQSLTQEIVDNKLNKLKGILEKIFTFDCSNISISKNLSKYVLKKFHKPLYYHSIFKGSFRDPYRHTQLTFMVGKLEDKFKSYAFENQILKNRLAQINDLYKGMLKIEKIPECKFVSVFDVQLKIIDLLLTEKDNFISLEKFGKIKSIFYAYRRKDIFKKINCYFSLNVPKLTSQEAAQEEVNCSTFNQIVSRLDYSRIKKLPSQFEEEDAMDIASCITNYNYKIFSDISFINHNKLIKSCTNITSACLKHLDDIKYISYPEKIIEMKIKEIGILLLEIMNSLENLKILKFSKLIKKIIQPLF